MMVKVKNRHLLFGALVIVIFTSVFVNGCVQTPTIEPDRKLPGIFPEKFFVVGNKIIDENGGEAILRGLTPIDPVTLANDANDRFIPFDEELFRKMSEWGAEIIRLPISPYNWRKYGKEKVFSVIDQSIAWSAKYGMYVYIDFHGIGFPPTEEYNDEWTKTTKREMINFWDEISKYYKDNNHVVFYELFNEPTFSGKFPPSEESLDKDWALWKGFVEEVVDVIRKNDPDSIIIVGGLHWATDASFVINKPIERDNIVYAVHPYPGTLFYPRTWDETYGEIQEIYPVYVTEFGYSLVAWMKQIEVQQQIREFVPSIDAYRQEAEANYENKEYVQELWDQMEAEIYGNEQARKYIEQLEEDYETTIKAYLDGRNIGWTAWSFSERYNTQLLENRDYTPTHSGRFFMDWLLEDQ